MAPSSRYAAFLFLFVYCIDMLRRSFGGGVDVVDVGRGTRDLFYVAPVSNRDAIQLFRLQRQFIPSPTTTLTFISGGGSGSLVVGTAKQGEESRGSCDRVSQRCLTHTRLNISGLSFLSSNKSPQSEGADLSTLSFCTLGATGCSSKKSPFCTSLTRVNRVSCTACGPCVVRSGPSGHVRPAGLCAAAIQAVSWHRARGIRERLGQDGERNGGGDCRI